MKIGGEWNGWFRDHLGCIDSRFDRAFLPLDQETLQAFFKEMVHAR